MKSIFLSLFILSTLTFNACGGGSSGTTYNIDEKLKSGKKLASRGDINIHEGYLELLKIVNPNIEKQLQNPTGKKKLIENLLDQEFLYRASQKRGIAKIDQYQQKAALYNRAIMAQGVLEEEVKNKAKEYYEKNSEKEFTKVGLAHILIKIQEANEKQKLKAVTPEQALAKAREAKSQLNGGTVWESVVTGYSDDRFTKTRGGDLGKLGREDRRVQRLDWKALIDQAFKMKTGEISEPILAKDGYHIIKVTEAGKVAPYAEVEKQIEFKLRGDIKKDVLNALNGKAKIEYHDEALKAKPAKPVTPPKPQPPVSAKPVPVKPQAPAPKAAKPEAKKATGGHGHDGHQH